MTDSKKTDVIGGWQFPDGMLMTPTARKLVALCYAEGFAFWCASFNGEFEVVATEVLKAQQACGMFRMFPLENMLVLARLDEMDRFTLTPAERGKQDGIIAVRSKSGGKL